MCTQFTKNCILADRLDRVAGFSSTRTMLKVSCSAQFLQNSAIEIVKLLNNVPGYAQLLAINLCTMTILRLRPNLYRDTAPVPFIKPDTGDSNSSRHKICTAIAPARNKICAMTAKTAPYPARHRDSLPAKEPGQVPGWLHRVTQPPFIAGPLNTIKFPFLLFRKSENPD